MLRQMSWKEKDLDKAWKNCHEFLQINAHHVIFQGV